LIFSEFQSPHTEVAAAVLLQKFPTDLQITLSLVAMPPHPLAPAPPHRNHHLKSPRNSIQKDTQAFVFVILLSLSLARRNVLCQGAELKGQRGPPQ
jgi:hypothetical protein